MKKPIALLLATLFLCGCAIAPAETQEPTAETQEPTAGITETQKTDATSATSVTEKTTEKTAGKSTSKTTVKTTVKTTIPKEKRPTMRVLISDEPGNDPFIVTEGAAPDPFVTYDEASGYYYAMSTQNNYIMLHRSRKLADVFKGGEIKIVYFAGQEINNSLWAPEMYFLDGRWYIYSSGAASAADSTKHMIALESETADPFDGFHFKAFIAKDLFAIDPTVWKDKKTGRNYLCFSLVKNGKQHLAVAELTNPYTIGPETVISSPDEFAWEGISINEGPFFVENGDRVFVMLSANGCYDDNYCIGVCELIDREHPLDYFSWIKYEESFLEQGNGVFAPGHASFFKSPDGTETWIAYQCYYSHNEGARRRMRVCHVQPISFNENGEPYIEGPLPKDTLIPAPSGE